MLRIAHGGIVRYLQQQQPSSSWHRQACGWLREIPRFLLHKSFEIPAAAMV
jgi:hypothetical protein